jgi:CDP-glucose 4,6-dehydratase
MSGTAAFWHGRRVVLTGHTGFKGSWTALWLERAGAEVTGLALAPEPGNASLFACLSPWPRLRSVIADVRDPAAVERIVAEADPEIVIHMAARAIVRRSFREPVLTFATNVMGTVNLLAATASRRNVRAILVVTSDKVYDNRDTGRSFREDDPLAGDDPYSASKAAAEAVARSWRESFLRGRGGAALGIARAGNVIGGGDWSEDRIVPDVVRAGVERRPVVLRYPQSTRPWQHVLDVVGGYLAYARLLATDPEGAPAALNFGPPATELPLPTGELVETLQAAFGWHHGWVPAQGESPPEKIRLALDPGLAAAALRWRPKLDARAALPWTALWHRAHLAGADMRAISLAQIEEHERLAVADTGSIAAA